MHSYILNTVSNWDPNLPDFEYASSAIGSNSIKWNVLNLKLRMIIKKTRESTQARNLKSRLSRLVLQKTKTETSIVKKKLIMVISYVVSSYTNRQTKSNEDANKKNTFSWK